LRFNLSGGDVLARVSDKGNSFVRNDFREDLTLFAVVQGKAPGDDHFLASGCAGRDCSLSSSSISCSAMSLTSARIFFLHRLQEPGAKRVRVARKRLHSNNTNLRTIDVDIAFALLPNGKERQYIDVRCRVGQHKVVIAGCFNVNRATELAGQIFAALKDARPLKEMAQPLHTPIERGPRMSGRITLEAVYAGFTQGETI
jgi:hypothetical protein